LVVANALLEALGNKPVEDLIEVSIVLHLGTLAAVLVYYRREIWRLLDADRRVIPLLIIGTLPAVVFGLLVKKGLSENVGQLILENALVAGFLFPVTAAALVWAARRPTGQTDYTQLRWQKALVIGLIQAVAVLPGISRSGTTIAAGLGVGMRRDSAATFAFLLAIPVIAGAGVLEGIEAIRAGATGTAPMFLAIGFVISFLVGLVALRLLVRWVVQGRLAMFAYYLVPLGTAVVAWQLLG